MAKIGEFYLLANYSLFAYRIKYAVVEVENIGERRTTYFNYDGSGRAFCTNAQVSFRRGWIGPFDTQAEARDVLEKLDAIAVVANIATKQIISEIKSKAGA